MPAEDRVARSRRAIEALRNGVPNREAVEFLGCNQPQAEKEFRQLLGEAVDEESPPSNVLRMMVSGDFGAGKSHLLAHFEHIALEQGFVCSKVTISKETPLYDLGKVFKSAVENGRIRNRNGRLIEELVLATDLSSKEYVSFFKWANEAAKKEQINGMFPAALTVHEQSSELELNSKIESFWGGERIKISEVRDGLRLIGQPRTYRFRAPKVTELPPQCLRFVTEMIKGAGYRGWVVFLDEIELIGTYAPLQRGRSYAELARWLGQSKRGTYPGLVVVGTVTDDFASEIISPDGPKKDQDNIEPRLSKSRYKDVAVDAKTGMRILEDKNTSLVSPTNNDVKNTIEKMKEVYRTAYNWPAPPVKMDAGGAGFQRRMRYKVRAAINEWDLLRHDPDSRPETEGEEFRHGYKEDPDMEKKTGDDDE